jgi:glycosyltransferase involved in cell wall biosynthesis
MKIALLGVFPPPYGGISIHIKRLFLALRDMNFDVQVFDWEWREEQTKNPYIKKINNKFLWILRQILSPEFDLFHFHTSSTHSKFLFVLAIASRFGLPVIITFHSLREEVKSGLPNKFIQWVLRSFNKIICVERHIYDKIILYEVPPSEVCVIPAYIPPNRTIDFGEVTHLREFFHNHHPILTANAFKLTFHEGVDLYGVDLCVELTRQLVEKYPKLGFIFVLPQIGNENYFSELQRRISKASLERNFLFSLSEIEYWPILVDCDIFLRPTSSDGFSISLKEALDLQVPSIASDVVNRPPGTVLFQSRNIGDLYKKVNFVLENYEDCKENIKLMEGNQASYFDKIVNVYLEVMDSNKRSSRRG